MDTKGLQKEFINWCKSKNKLPKSEDETKQLFVAFMKEKHPEEYKQAMLNQQKQQTTKALHGAKLNYFKSLKHQCAEDEEVVYYKKGGSVTCGCKKKEEGGEVTSAKDGAVTKFKKRKMNTGGNFLANVLFTAAGMQRGYEKATEKPKTKPKKKLMFQGKEQDIVGETLKRGNENSGPKAKGPVDEAQADNKGYGKNKCGGKVKKKAKGSKINKDCGGSAIAKFKALRNGGSLNGIPFMQKGTPEGGMKTRYDNFSWWDFVPFVGSYRDIMRAYDYPSTGNIINAGLSTAGDALGLGAIGAVAKAASKYNKIAKALKASGFFRPTGVGRLWIKVGTKQTPINAGKFGTIGTKTEPAVFTKTVPEVDLTEPVMWGFSAVPARTIKNSLYEPNQ